MTFPTVLADAVATHIDGPIRHASPVGGGCIANATRLETDQGTFFLKFGRGAVAHTFPAEAAGLRALRDAGSPLVIPAVLVVEDETAECPGFLLMAWVEAGVKGVGFWEAFGRGLASMHRHKAERYGFVGDNYIGRLAQINTWADTWPVFFRHNRLEPQVKRAREAGRWLSGWNRALDVLYRRLDDLVPEVPPSSILHGDLWSGNFLVTIAGEAALIDPATYYGHREADLAMTELFGGFPDRFYQAYREAWPFEPGYPIRREIYNLYHLLNHLNHFGSGYTGGVEAVLKQFE